MRTLLTLILVFLTQASIAADHDSYLGLEHPPYPSGCSSKGGGIVWSNQFENEFGFSHVECANKNMVWLSRFLRREGKRAVWQVEDVIVLPALRSKQVIDFADCEYKKDRSAHVIAIGTWVNRKVGGYMKGISSSWILNPKNRKIERIPPRDVTCEVDDDRD